MSAFTENLIVSPLPDGKTWVLRKSFSYDVGEKDSGETIKVPAGFLTDFTTIPRIFWAILPRWGKYGNAAVIHDYLYWMQFEKYSRKRADQIFLEGMLVLNTRKWIAKIIYLSVKYFGSIAWYGNTKAKAKGIKRFIDIPQQTIEIPDIQLKDFVR
ncbi:MAG: DUF1353 domain-containing protein [Sedimentisphaerales bacterium]|nr:DUF1353 domain-containing protein [Sedimentisphaerales bacterium]